MVHRPNPRRFDMVRHLVLGIPVVHAIVMGTIFPGGKLMEQHTITNRHRFGNGPVI